MNRFYYATHILGILLSIIYLIIIAPKYEIKRSRAVLCACSSLAVGALIMKLLHLIFFGTWGGQNLIRIFVFTPFLTFGFAKLFRIPTVKFTDLSAPAICIVMGIAKIGCQYVGCCRSWLQVDWGILNRFTETKLFPVQLAESAVSLLIAAVLILNARKHHYENHGRQMPLMLILFGSTRLILEFFRDNEKILFGLSEFSIWSILMVIEGIILLILLTHFDRHIEKKTTFSEE